MWFVNFLLLFFGIFWVMMYINTTVADIASAKVGGSTRDDIEKAAKLRLAALTLAALNWAVFIVLRI